MPKLIRLELTPADRDELERRLRTRTIAHREHERLAMIRAVGDGATIPQAARALGVHEQTVRAFVARFAAEGFAGLTDRPRPGRPPRLTDADLAAVEARLDADAAGGVRIWTAPQLAAWLAEERGVRISAAHLGARLKTRGFRWKRTRRATPHKQPDPDRQEDAAADLALLRFMQGLADLEVIDVLHLDESGFAPTLPTSST
ncbi:MAG: IS630 family transposase [Thermomicrobiales bacterium]